MLGRQVQAAGLLRALYRVLTGLGLVVVALYASVCHWLMFRTLRSLNYNDFGKFYYSLIQWRDGKSMYGPSPATLIPFAEGRSEQFWNMNPPHFHLLLLPFSRLPIDRAYFVWTIVNLAVLLLAICFAVRELALRPKVTWIALVVLAFASAPALTWAVTGQLTGLIVGAVTFIWLSVRRERWTAAGVMLGIACSVKPFLGVLGLYLLLRRQWRAAFISLTSFAAAFWVGWAAFGGPAHREWLQALGEAEWVGAVMNASVYGVVGRAWTLDVFGGSGPVALIGGVLAVLVLGASIVAMQRAKDQDRALLIALSASLLASPLGWVYYVPILAAPLMALAARGQIERSWYLPMAGFLIPHFILYPFHSHLFALTAASIYTWSLLGLLVLAMRAPGSGTGDSELRPSG